METASALFHRWCELSSDTPHNYKEEYDWTTNELRNCLRSIEWDLEDLEETINILYLIIVTALMVLSLHYYHHCKYLYVCALQLYFGM